MKHVIIVGFAIAAGCDGRAATAVDASIDASTDANASVYPAPHPLPPRVISLGGSVLAHAKLVPVTFSGDPLAAQIDSFVALVPTSSYWTAVVADYGAAAPATLPPIHVAESVAALVPDADLQTWLAGKLDGTHAEWPSPDADTLYLLFYPPGTVNCHPTAAGGGTDCPPKNGYHSGFVLPNGKRVTYAVISRNPLPIYGEGAALTGISKMTAIASHEIAEAITDPAPVGAPAFKATDADHYVDTLITGGEVGDLCEVQAHPYYVPADFPYMVARAWSNSSAAAGHDPCAPIPTSEPYFNTAPVLPDSIPITLGTFSFMTKAVTIPVGSSRTIELDLFSDAPSEAWTVTATEFPVPASPHISFAFDTATGKNGDKLSLTIHAITTTETGYPATPFMLVSTLGARKMVWWGFVGN